MKLLYSITVSILLFFSLDTMSAQSIWSSEHLEEVKSKIDSPLYKAAYKSLLEKADSLLNVRALSVMMKNKIPASNNKHDYMSQARYYWPDTTKADGLPYIRIDGLSNPELQYLDRDRLGETASRIKTLSLAWYFSGDEKYASQSIKLIRTWFLDDSTKMNPNLEYAQMIPGHNSGKGRSYGLIDGYSFVEMLDGVQLLKKSRSFNQSDSQKLKEWFSKLLEWYLKSKQGIDERNNKNNHATAYDAQVIAFAMYVGEKNIARQFIDSFPKVRTFVQITPDGRQPLELSRTLAYGYSVFNMTHYADIFLMSRKLNLYPDRAVSQDGRNYYKAIDYLSNYIGKKVSEWPYKQIDKWEEEQKRLQKELYRVWLLNPSQRQYRDISMKYFKENPDDIFLLLYM